MAQYLGTDFFVLLARLDAGEWHWLYWAETMYEAEEDAYGPGGLPVGAPRYTVPWRMKLSEE